MPSSKLVALLSVGWLVALLSMMVGCAPPEVEDTEARGETASHQLAGDRLTPSEVASQLRAAGFAENTIGKMVCTAKYESSYYDRATNRNGNGSMDRGLFQINSLHIGKTEGCPSSGEALFRPGANAKCALAVFKSQGITAWYGYKKHKTECDRTKAPGGAAAPAAGEDDDEATTTTPTATTNTSTDDSATDATVDKEPEPTIDPNDDYDLGAGCYSATTKDTMAPHSCVKQATTGIWFQCNQGKWYRGGDDVQGAYGYCNGAYPRE